MLFGCGYFSVTRANGISLHVQSKSTIMESVMRGGVPPKECAKRILQGCPAASRGLLSAAALLRGGSPVANRGITRTITAEVLLRGTPAPDNYKTIGSIRLLWNRCISGATVEGRPSSR